MSKLVKNMEIQALRKDFEGLKDMLIVEVNGVDSLANSGLRTNLRKKKIRLKLVKNSFAKKIFSENGISFPNQSIWSGPTAIAWGAASIAELSREFQAELKNPKTSAGYKDKVKVKSAVADGSPVSFELALKMPTREEAISNILGLILSPAGRLAAQLTAPGGVLAGQIKTISEKTEGAASAN